MKRLVYRVDGGPELGLGHIARALAVRQAFRNRPEWEVMWATAGGVEVERAASDGRTKLIRPEEAEGEEAFLWRAADSAAAIIVDRKLPYGPAFIEKLNRRCPVVMLDVPCDGMFAAACTVFPVAHLDPAIVADPRWRAGGRLLHGSPWVILHPGITAAKTTPELKSENAIVVTAGGADPSGVSRVVLDWLDGIGDSFTVDLLVGTANSRREELRARAREARHPTQVYEKREDFPALLQRATLAIATFGITAYELAFLGVPAVLVSHNEENAEASIRFVRQGSALYLGIAAQVTAESFAWAVTRLLRDRGTRAGMMEAGQRLVDGHGAERLAAVVEELVCQ